jgi:trimeric autotransporter adhesin
MIVVNLAMSLMNRQVVRAGTLPPESQNRDMWTVNGDTHAIAVSGNTAYLGGDFTKVCQYTGAGVPVDASGNAVATYPDVQHIDASYMAYIMVSISDGSGGWYIGGDFNKVGTETRNHIAHIKSDGTVDATWNPDADDDVMSLFISGNTLYVGGSFHLIGGQTRMHIAAIDISNGSTGSATTWDPNANNWVLTLFVNGGYVYAGGDFTKINGSSLNKIARINISDGLPDLGWTPNSSGGANRVSTIYVSDSVVYVGGSFTSVGGQLRNRIAALNNTDGQAVPGWDANANSGVSSIVVSGSTVYVGGIFTIIGGHSLNRLAKLSTTDGHADDTWNPNADAEVETVSLSGSILYIGGIFTTVSGQQRLGAAAVNIADGTITSWDPSTPDIVHSLAADGTNIYIGMEGSGLNGLKCKLRNGLAAIDLTTGEPTDWNPDSDALYIYALAISGSKIYVGGGFDLIGGQTLSNLAVLDLVNGTADATWAPNPNDYVNAITVSGSTIYAGGDFTTIGGASKAYLAALNNTNGNVLGSWTADTDGSVYALAQGSDRLFAGGYFSTVNSVAKRNMAAISLTDGSLISGWSSDTNVAGYIYSLVVEGTSLYTGGSFSSINSTPINNLAKINASDGALDTAWVPDPDDDVNTLLYNDGNLYVGGAFSTLHGGADAYEYLAAVNPLSTGSTLSWKPNPDSSVKSFAVSGSSLLAGGNWSNLHGEGYYGNSGTNAWPYFAVFGTPGASPTATSTPTTTPAPTATPTPGPTTTTCNDQKPSFAPNLFQIDRNGTSAILYFAPAGDPVTGYQISYGITSEASGQDKSFSMSQCTSAISYTINNLIAEVTYYFKVKGVHGCSSTDWSNVRKTEDDSCVYCSIMPEPSITPTPTTLLPETTATITPKPTPTIEESKPIIPVIKPTDLPIQPVIETSKKVLSGTSDVAVGTVAVVGTGTVIVSSLAAGQTLFQMVPIAAKSIRLWPELFNIMFLPFFGFLRKKQRTLGIVLDSVTNQPVVGAYVLLFSSSGNLKTAFTDKNGRFSFSQLKPDTYKIRVDHSQYKFLSTLVTVNENNLFTRIYQGEDLFIEKEMPFSNMAIFGDPGQISLSGLRKLSIKLSSLWHWFFVKNFYFFGFLFLDIAFISFILTPTKTHVLIIGASLATILYNLWRDLSIRQNSGIVVDQNNKPREGIPVELYLYNGAKESGNFYASTISDSGGRYLFTPDEGSYILRVKKDNGFIEKVVEINNDHPWIKEKIVVL